MKRLYRSAYLYRSKTFGGYEMAKRDNTNCKQKPFRRACKYENLDY